jgi:hypothetical protein
MKESNKTPHENKTHYGGIYFYLMKQKLANQKSQENPTK